MTAGTRTVLPAPARHRRALTWAVPQGWVALSSAAVGGGLTRPRWVLNAGVDGTFARTDLAAWAAETAGALGLRGEGCALLTAADVAQVEHADRGGVQAWATVGVTRPTWPHDPRLAPPVGRSPSATGREGGDGPPAPGTVNIVVALPVPLTPSALVQALATVTEAKAQVLVRAGVPGTGTASDAVVVLCPGDGGTADDGGSGGAADAEVSTDDGGSGVAADEAGFADAARTAGRADLDGGRVPFAGVRSRWGGAVAHAVHDAVLAGLTAHPWTRAPGEEHVW